MSATFAILCTISIVHKFKNEPEKSVKLVRCPPLRVQIVRSFPRCWSFRVGAAMAKMDRSAHQAEDLTHHLAGLVGLFRRGRVDAIKKHEGRWAAGQA